MTAANKYRSVTGYLERLMKELNDSINTQLHNIKLWEHEIESAHEDIAILKVHYTSLLNTALAYEDFDKEDFESGL